MKYRLLYRGYNPQHKHSRCFVKTHIISIAKELSDIHNLSRLHELRSHVRTAVDGDVFAGNKACCIAGG